MSAAFVSAACALLPASSEAQWQTLPAPPPPGKTARLSDERKLTVSAYVALPGPIYVSPDDRSPIVDSLHMTTEDGYLESYLALRAYTDLAGHEWTQIRIPGRPNGRTGWVPRRSLDAFEATHWLIVVNRRRLKMTLYWNGKRRWQRPVGIGKHASPTPAGHFWIREIIKVHKRKSPYFPYALGTSDYSTLSEWPGGGVVGIHGDWNQPQFIPGRPSHGCIRMRDRDVASLARWIHVGTPLRVL